ncbi:MAG TPA: hypothetical protein VFQ25_05665 [Ktedonobacterales bacterium]|nr:hypothetical protein [Ktedonobacterales bacterium]
MDKHARLEEIVPAWRPIVSRLRTLTGPLPPQILATLRTGRRLLALSQPRLWRFALLPIAVAVSLLITAGSSISWGLVTAEALAAICALSGWAILRASKLAPLDGLPHLAVGACLLIAAALAALPLLASSTGTTLALGALALAVFALDLPPAVLRVRPPRAVLLVVRRVVAPLLLGLGVVMVTAFTQRARPDTTLWLLGIALSLLVFATIQAHDIAIDGAIADIKSLWPHPLAPLVAALALAGALVIAAALPTGAPHGLLLALWALPVALVAVTGLWRSTFIPARALAAHGVDAVFTFVALALTAGALASAMVAATGAALAQALGG